jgi:hypothetical protein
VLAPEQLLRQNAELERDRYVTRQRLARCVQDPLRGRVRKFVLPQLSNTAVWHSREHDRHTVTKLRLVRLARLVRLLGATSTAQVLIGCLL